MPFRRPDSDTVLPFRRRTHAARAFAALCGGVLLTTCTDNTGPGAPVPGFLSLAPRYVSEAAGIVPVSAGRFVLTRQPGGEVAKDTVVAIAAGADSVDLAFTVQMQTPGETFLLQIRLVGTAGDTVFRAGPLEMTPSTSGTAPVPVEVPLTYSGTGANAASVVITPPTGVIVAGTPAPIAAQALDGTGSPIPGTPIAWASLDTNVVQVPDPAVGSVLGQARGTGRIVATLLTGPADTVAVTVVLPPSSLVADSGSNQTGPAGELLPQPLVARVTASDGVGVPDVWVRFAVTLGGGSVSADSVLSDSTGRARVDWTLGNVVGSQTVTATTAALPSASVAFTATSQSTGAGAVTIAQGDQQSAVVSTVVQIAPEVLVEDIQGNPVPNVQVIFAVTQGGGTLTGDTATTDASGFASVGSWTLGSSVGLNTLTATVDALTPVQFVALATSTGGVTSMTLNEGDLQTALAGTAVPLAPSVLLTDTAGVPIEGAEVEFLVTQGNGSISVTLPVSDVNGVASPGTWTLGAPGTNSLVASMPGISPITFSAEATVGAPAQVLVVSGDAQSDTAGTTLPLPLVVEVQDSAGNAVPNVAVTWNTFDGSVLPVSSTTNGTGQAQTSWTLGVNAIDQNATAAVSGLTPAVFSATAIFPNPSILMELAGTDRIRLADSALVDITLTQPAPVGGVVLNFSVDNASIIGLDTTDLFIPETGTTTQLKLYGVSQGTTTVRATATGYTDGAVAVPVSIQVLSMPGTLNVPFGSTTSLPLQISAPAPAGGVTVTLVSDAPTILGVVTATVTIAEGAQTANATLEGLLPGTADITGTTVDFGAAATVANVTADLNITITSSVIYPAIDDTVTIRLESAGAPIAAPSPGIPVTLTSQDPTCVAPTSPVTILEGLVSVDGVLSYGGSAALPCSTRVVATAENIASDSITVTVNPPPGINLSVVTVGAGLQIGTSGSLGASNHGGVDVTIRSLDPATLLIAPDQATVGAETLVRTLTNGTTGFSYTAQAFESVADTGAVSVAVEVSAPGFVTDTVIHTIRQAGYRLAGVSTTTTSLSPDDPFVVQLGVLRSDTVLQQFQNLRAGSPGVTATIVLSDSAVASLKSLTDSGGTVTVAIPEQNYQSPSNVATGGAAVDPLLAGSTTLTASIPGLVAEKNNTTATVTITAPVLNLSVVTVGAGLQIGTSGSLGATNHGGVDVTIRSLDPATLLIAPDQATVGAESLVRTVPDGSTGFSYTVQAFENVADTGAVSVAVEVTAPGFVTDTVIHTIRQAGYRLAGVTTSTTSLSPDDPFVIQLGVLRADTVLQQFQNLRAGSTGVTATIVLSDSAVASLKSLTDSGGTVTVAIPEQNYQSPSSVATGGAAVDPLLAGSTTLTASIPGLVAEKNNTTATVTITAPGINLSLVTVGAGLQIGTSGSLGATNHGGVDVTIRSLDPATLLIAPDQATVGAESLVRSVPDGSTGFSYTVQAFENVADTGAVSVAVEVTAPGFTTDTVIHTIRQAGYRLAGLNASTTTLTPDDPFVIQLGVLRADTVLQQFQNLRAGSAGVTATITSSAPSVGQLVTTTVTGTSVTVAIPEQNYQSPTSVASGGVAFQPLTTGSTTVSASIPGLVPEKNGTATTVAVTTPGITVNAATVGSGLQIGSSVFLGASDYGDSVAVKVWSSNPAVALIAPDQNTPGTDTITVWLKNGATGLTYYLQGVEFQTGSVLVTARADGFTDGSASSSVVTPALRLAGLPTSISATAADDPFVVQIGIPNGTNTDLQQFQNVRAGAPGPLTATVETETSGFAQLVTTATTGTSVTVEIPSLTYQSQTTVANGGVAFDPLAEGAISVFATIPTFVTLPTATVAVTVTP